MHTKIPNERAKRTQQILRRSSCEWYHNKLAKQENLSSSAGLKLNSKQGCSDGIPCFCCSSLQSSHLMVIINIFNLKYYVCLFCSLLLVTGGKVGFSINLQLEIQLFSSSSNNDVVFIQTQGMWFRFPLCTCIRGSTRRFFVQIIWVMSESNLICLSKIWVKKT